jgi:hypothetical protein
MVVALRWRLIAMLVVIGAVASAWGGLLNIRQENIEGPQALIRLGQVGDGGCGPLPNPGPARHGGLPKWNSVWVSILPEVYNQSSHDVTVTKIELVGDHGLRLLRGIMHLVVNGRAFVTSGGDPMFVTDDIGFSPELKRRAINEYLPAVLPPSGGPAINLTLDQLNSQDAWQVGVILQAVSPRPYYYFTAEKVYYVSQGHSYSLMLYDPESMNGVHGPGCDRLLNLIAEADGKYWNYIPPHRT